jgi:Flp pilus assembly protein TadB
MTVYWILAAPLIGAICVLTRWADLPDRDERMRLARTQALHWIAVLVAMHLMFVTDAARMMNPEASALAALVLLALGTFTAGVHLAAGRLCLIGAIMAAAVPGIAWLGRTALLWLLATLLAVAIAALIIWNLRRWRRPEHTPQPIH